MIDEQLLVQLTQSLVQIPSITGEEKEVVQFLAETFARFGFDEVIIDENGSVIGIIRGKKPGPLLLLDAHCDTVGIAPGAAWRHAPFGGEVVDGRLYGRGSSDMKGALAAMIVASAAVAPRQIAGTVAVSATVLEEVMEGVALQGVIERLRPDYVVIGEATDLRINHGGRGRAEIQLEAHGTPAHSSTPHLGDNAVLKLLPAIEAINKLPERLDPLLGSGIMALTDIISDPYPGYSVIPSRCRATYDRRLLTGETPSSVLQELQTLPELTEITIRIAQGSHQSYTGATLAGAKFFPAWQIPADHQLVRAARAGVQAAGLTGDLGAYSFCTNAAYSAGQAGIPTIGFGPSQETMAHIADEYIECAQLTAAAQGYAQIIQQINQPTSIV